jgi:nuclear GTP-binding protein
VNKDTKNGGVQKKLKKDPGIPSCFPGKTEFIQKMQEERDKEKMQRQMAIARNDLAALSTQAVNRAAAHPLVKDGANSEKEKFFDNSKRAFYREFKTVVDAADVILTVLDARDPLGCRVKAVEEMVASSGGRKRIVLVLNKIDLVPREVVAQWLTHLRRELPTVAFKASTQSQRSNLGSISGGENNEGALSSSECLGADTLVQLLKNYCRSLNIKTSIRVGVVGYPNVGKSSLINSLKRAKVCKVGATPGVTTASQEIHLDKNIKLLDCPGIVFANPSDSSETAQLFLRNCVKVEQLDDPVGPIELILQRAAPEQLMFLYSIPRFVNTQEFLFHVARRQGKLKKGGIPNIEAAAKSVLTDWNQGKIPFYTIPPALPTSNTGEAVIVGNWAPEFDIDSLATMEVEMLSNIAEELSTNQPILMEADDAAPALVVATIPTKGKNILTKDEYSLPALSVAEMENNPQLNRNRQKSLKMAKKAAAKRNGNTTMISNEMQVDDVQVNDAYNFATDYIQPQ